MFEKEAEEYAENREVCGLLDAISENLQNYDYGTVAHYNIDPLVEECFKDGAEFAYNKANEWHWIKDGDFPEEEKEYLTINKDAISEENALECLNIYYFATINSLALQSVCEENGEVDIEKAMDKTKRIIQILDEK